VLQFAVQGEVLEVWDFQQTNLALLLEERYLVVPDFPAEHQVYLIQDLRQVERGAQVDMPERAAVLQILMEILFRQQQLHQLAEQVLMELELLYRAEALGQLAAVVVLVFMALVLLEQCQQTTLAQVAGVVVVDKMVFLRLALGLRLVETVVFPVAEGVVQKWQETLTIISDPEMVQAAQFVLFGPASHDSFRLLM
jgi:hypothetical protein